MLKKQDKKVERDFFNKHAYGRLFAEWRSKSYVDFFLKHSNLSKNAKILDLGCVNGSFGKSFLKKGFQVVGLDLSFVLVQQAAKQFPVVLSDAENTPFLDKSFDAVIGAGLIHHFPDPKNLLNEVTRILKDSGYFFTEDPNILNPKIFFSYAQVSPLRIESSENENPINFFYLKRILKSKFQRVKIEHFCLLPPQWNLPDNLVNMYLKIEKLFQKTPLKYLLGVLLSVNTKIR